MTANARQEVRPGLTKRVGPRRTSQFPSWTPRHTASVASPLSFETSMASPGSIAIRSASRPSRGNPIRCASGSGPPSCWNSGTMPLPSPGARSGRASSTRPSCSEPRPPGRLARLRGGAQDPTLGAHPTTVSEAVYLTDPEGNGIEVYVDRPSSEWPRAEDGSIIMRNDGSTMPASARRPSPWRGACRGRSRRTRPSPGRGTGHRGALLRGPARVRRDVPLPGRDIPRRRWVPPPTRDQHLEQPGRPGAPAGMAGLAEVELQIDTGTLAKVRGRCLESGSAMTDDDGATVLHDPWGTRLRLVPSSV